ncbi:hypothetical protein FE257_006182 [Aspergillus nanangensis]|uniref:Calcium-transporting ATPase n=1 Tax=Aspergillus nanangensis TaxID=2582783 RepID=A0AAD4CR39_ASPNN|nr:hypothetical protein FE257_006182 [Aspergillus nanangensis]
MADSRSDSKQSTPLRRERAPTITIDTSAVTPTTEGHPPPQIVPQPPPQSSFQSSDNAADATTDTRALLNSDGVTSSEGRSPASVRSFASSEARDLDSRPTSPHNFSSPASKMTEPISNSNFLAVPGARSRGNSLESEDTNHSSGSYGGDTYVATAGSQESRGDVRNVVLDDEEALKADPGHEQDFEVENNSFAFSPGQLNKLLNPKNPGALHALGGMRGLEKGLRTNINSGLSLDETKLEGAVSFEDAKATNPPDSMPKSVSQPPPRQQTNSTVKLSEDSFADRKRVFSDNRLPERKPKNILQLAWIAYNDKVIILLTIAAVVSLALGIYQSVRPLTDEEKKKGGHEARVEWVEGVAIIVAILIVVVVGAANDWQKERQFVKLNKKKDNRQVKVIRSGRTMEISVHDVLVGDVMHLEPGDMVPVDGVFIDGHNVKCDESSATGESDLLRKTPGDDVFRAIKNHENISKLDPFIVSGAKISEGVGTFLVTSVGIHSTYGKTMMSLHDEGQTTPLQGKLNMLAEYIAKLGLSAGLLLFVVLFIKFLANLKHYGSADEKGQAFLQIFIVAVTVVVVAVPEGLPLAVTLALAFATTRMLKDNNLVRLLRACETMGNATTICSDKTGTLTENKMTAVAATLGTALKFGDKSARPSAPNGDSGGNNNDGSTMMSPSEFAASLAGPTKRLLLDSIVLNSTAFEGEDEGKMTFIGSKTETALLGWARTYLGMGSVSEARSNAQIAQMVPFDSGRKCMAVVVKMDQGKYRMLVKGASEILVAKSTRIVSDPTQDLSDVPISDGDQKTLDSTITRYASHSLRTIGLVYRDFEQWPPRGARMMEDDRSLVDFDSIFRDMVVLGIVGIQDPLRSGVTESVQQCQRAGVFVRMVTGDNIMTAKAIAQECGIFTAGGIAMEGPKFRKLSSRQMTQIIPRLQVLARSSPNDKKILVTQLKKLGETVAVTGDGTNDAPALKTADVGFSMGIAGTEVAKEASDIILMDDNFASIVKAMAWGRTVNDAVKKFLQFQITVNITAVLLTFVSAVANADQESVLTAVQLLWVNLIMDTFAALALATDPPTPDVLDRRPEPKSAPLINPTMWKMIIGQSIYQLAVTFVLNFAGTKILGYKGEILSTVVFNTFVWMQIFNQWNSRRLDNGFNIFSGVLRNWWFLGIQIIIVGGQIMIIFVGGQAFSVVRLNGAQWGVSLVLGVISLPVAVIIRLIPDELISRLIPRFWQRKKSPKLLVSDEDRRFEWNPALVEIRDQLKFIKTVRGGRLRHLKHKLQHPEELLPRSRSGSRSRDDSNSIPGTPVGDGSTTPPQPPTPESRSRLRTRSRSNSAFGPAAAMAGVVAGSIAGWSPIERPPSGEEESFRFNTGNPRSGLSTQQGIEIHPDTAADDQVVGDYLASSKTPPSQNPDLLPFFEHAPPARAPSSRTSGIIAGVQLAEMILKYCGGYIRDVKDAKSTIASLESEISSVKKVLEDIQLQLKSPGGKKLQTSRSLQEAVSGGTLELELEKVKSILDKLQDRKLARFKWSFKKPDITASITNIGRCKQNIILALQIDQTALLVDTDKDAFPFTLPVAPGAFFDSFNDINEECLPNTRTDILRQVTEWAEDPTGACIFRLDGMAEKDQLGASFFFKRGEGLQGDASRLFTTIAQQLLIRIHGLRPIIQQVLTKDPLIPERSLREQFQSLILKPLNELKGVQHTTLIIVIDALDECEPRRDVRIVIQLLALLKDVKTVSLRVFITGRPEAPIPSGFKNMDESMHQDLVLHETPQVTIQHDISLFLEYQFNEIRREFMLPSKWPGDKTMQTLLEIVLPLFICASTICRFISDPRWMPEERLKHVLSYGLSTQVSKLDFTYLPVLDQLLIGLDGKEKEVLLQEFREVVGSIVVLCDPLSAVSLAKLLGLSQQHVTCRIHLLQSVLKIPTDEEQPIRLLHLSFRDFLVDDQKRDSYEFWIDEKERHGRLAQACLEVLSGPGVFKDNICGLSSPGALRTEISQDCLPPEVQYSCRYWVPHVKGSDQKLHDDGEVHRFLGVHLLHWIECSAVLGELHRVIDHVEALESLVANESGTSLAELLHDTKRFVMRNKPIISTAPLQICHSALIFAPKKSVIRQIFAVHIPDYISPPDNVDLFWSAKLHSFRNDSNIHALSPDARLFASASSKVIKLWDIQTGECHNLADFQTDFIPPHIKFSPDCQLLLLKVSEVGIQHAAPRMGGDTKVWNLNTGTVEHTFDACDRLAFGFTPRAQLLATHSKGKIQIWDLLTGELKQRVACDGHNGFRIASGIVFSPDAKHIVFAFGDLNTRPQIKVWDVTTGHLLRLLDGYELNLAAPFDSCGKLVVLGPTEEGFHSQPTACIQLFDISTDCLDEIINHSHPIRSVSFSCDGKLVVTSGNNREVSLWALDTRTILQTWTCSSFRNTRTSFTPNGKLIISGNRCDVEIFDQLAERNETSRQFSPPAYLLKITQDGKIVHSVSSDGEVGIWDIASQTHQKTWTLPRASRGKDYGRPLSSNMPVVFSMDGSLLASGLTDKLEIWNTFTGDLIQQIDDEYGPATTVSHSNQVIAVGHGGGINLWNTLTGELRKTYYTGQSREINCLSFSPDCSLLASASKGSTVQIWQTTKEDWQQSLEGHPMMHVGICKSGSHIIYSDSGTVAVWNIEVGHLEQTLPVLSGAYRPILSPDGQLVAVVLKDGKTIQLLELSTGTLRRQWTAHTCSYMSFSHDGQMLISSGFFDPPSQQTYIVQSWDTVTGEPGNTLMGHEIVTSFLYRDNWSSMDGFLSDGRVGLREVSSGAINYWDPKSNDLQPLVKAGFIRIMAFSPDGQFMAGWVEGYFKLWNLMKAKPLEYTLHLSGSFLCSMAFSHDSCLLAIGELGGKITIWKLRSGDQPKLWKEEFDRYNRSVSFTQQGKVILLGGLPKIWDLNTGELQPIFRHLHADVEELTLSPDGLLIATYTLDRTIMIWEVCTVKLLSIMDLRGIEIKEMAFVNDNSTLVTDKGCFQISDPLSGPFFHRPKPSPRIYVKDDWVYRGGERVLWLPDDYRPRTFVEKEGVLVLGTESRGVVFLKFKS